LGAYAALFEGKQRKRLLGNLFLLYLFCALFFPLMTYNLGMWGLAKYYLIPLMVYHFWASSFFKTSSLFELLEINDKDLSLQSTLMYFKYPKWVEFLSGELNYAISSIQQLVEMPAVPAPSDTDNVTNADSHKDEASEPKPVEKSIPFYNLKDAFQFVADQKTKLKQAAVEIKELHFVSLLMSRTGDLIQAKDEIAETLSKISWVTTIWLITTPLMALYGLLFCEYHWQTWTLGFVHYLAGGIGITGGYHRLFSHRAYKAHPIFKNFLVFVSTGCFEMSVFDWCIDHRAHHRYTDTDKDPYSINKGFFYAHIGWLLFKREVPVVSDISDLEKDPVLQFQHKYYPFLALLQGLVLPTVIAGYFWGDYLGGFLIAGVLTRVFVQHATFCVNSVAHYFGEFTYSDSRTPRDSWWVGLVSFGEGYHNFHHEFPYDYRNGYGWKNFDPTKWLIWALAKIGLTYDLLFFDKNTIAKGEVQMKEKRLQEQRAALHWGPPEETLPSWTMSYVVEQTKAGERLMACEGYVHDVRKFIDEHPGGPGIMRPYMGKDITRQFNGSIYNHSNAARNVLRTLRVAKLVPEADAAEKKDDAIEARTEVIVDEAKEHQD